jgi:hypothetical protein
MNRPTFITMSTLIFGIVAYVALAQMPNAAVLSVKASSTSVALGTSHVQGR